MAKLMYDELKEILCNELNNVAKKGGLNKESLETTHKLASSLNDLVTANAMMEEGFGGYTERSYRRDGYNYDSRGAYDYGRNYDGRRGRDGDNDGRYNERNYRGGYDSYGSSYEKERTMDRLDHMMQEAGSESERNTIRRIKNELQNS